jgi:hypothetical protein
MALKAWRHRGRVLVECDACTSRGHSAAPEIVVEVDPQSARVRETVNSEARALRQSTEGKINEAMRLYKIKSSAASSVAEKQRVKQEVFHRVKEISGEHGAGIQAIIEKSPGMEDGLVHKIAKCPWCGAPGDAVVVSLADDSEGPDEWVANKTGAAA